MMKRLFASLLATAMIAGAATAAHADEAATKYRQANMEIIGGHMHSIVPIVKGQVSNTADLVAHAKGLAAAAAMTEGAFKTKALEGKTEAKAAIWEKWDDFSADSKKMAEEANKLAEVAATGDSAAIGAQLGALGKTCKGCHDTFKKD